MEHKSNNNRIDIILGPMFSGKSTELLRRCSRLEVIGKKVLYVNHIYDKRTDDSIQTHSFLKQKATKVERLEDLYITYSNLYKDSDIIAIDEAQFFPDLYAFVLKCERDEKSVIMSGLDGDSNRKPFGQILECIPLCDTVVKLSAMDMIDKDGSEAIFSKRINKDDKSQVSVGASDKYVAVNRKNYLS